MTGENKIWVASFDIGTKNFAFCIEEFDENMLSKIPKIPKNKRYFDSGELTESFRKEIKKVYLNGKIVLLQKIDITPGCDEDKYYDPKLIQNMTSVLDNYLSYWDKCAAFVIEQQMSYTGRQGYGRFPSKKVLKINSKAVKVGQHVNSYFNIIYGGIKPVFEFPSYYKTQILGAPKKLSDSQRKKWAVDMAKNILSERGDFEIFQRIDNYAKKDDVSDVIVQAQAWKYLMFVDKQKLL
jgi:hypothetical protein